MNTADRSIALLDVALRRRFAFVEIMPRSDLLDSVIIESEAGSIDLGRLLARINRSIIKHIDRDHQIGHSYFMKVADAAEEDRIEVLEFVCKGCEPKPFKALVQLRGFSEPVLGDYEKSLKKLKSVRNGFDLQFASSRAANSYYKWVLKRFPGLEVKRTKSLVTLKQGKRVYRPTILLRKPKSL